MKNKTIIGLFALFIIGLISIATITYAYRGNVNEIGPNYNSDVHNQLQDALSAKDYDTWIKVREDNNLPMKGKMFQVINRDNFEKYVELHNANIAGDTTKVDFIKAELGLGQGMMKRSRN